MLIFSTILIIIKYNKLILLFILAPIKRIKIENINLQYQIENEFLLTYANLKNNIYIPIIEINLPFFTTSYIYIKYILFLSFYILIPIILYLIYINISFFFYIIKYFIYTLYYNTIFYFIYIYTLYRVSIL